MAESGNQIGGACTLLKEHCDAEEAAGAAPADAAERASPAVETPPKKRRSYVAGYKVAPSKKRKSKSVAVAVAISRILRVEGAEKAAGEGAAVEVIDLEDEADGEQALVAAEPATPADCATRVLRTLVLAKALEDAPPTVNAADVSALWAALDVEAPSSVHSRLEQTVSALVRWTKSARDEETAKRQESGARAAPLGVGADLFSASDAAVNALRDSLATQTDPRASSKGAEELVARITASALARLENLQRVFREREKQRECERASEEMAALRGRLGALVQQNEQRLGGATRAFEAATEEQDACARRLSEIADERATRGVRSGLSVLSAKMQSLMDVLGADTAKDVVALREEATSANGRARGRQVALQQARDELGFHEAALGLLDDACRHRAESDNETMARLKQSGRALAEGLAGFFESYLPVLADAMVEAFTYCSSRRERVKAERARLKQKLARHLDLYDGGQQERRRVMEQRIRALEVADAECTKVMAETLGRQHKLWRQERELLPPRVLQLVLKAFRGVHERLEGDAREAVGDFLDGIGGQVDAPKPAASDTTAVAPVEVANVAPKVGGDGGSCAVM